MNIKNLILNQIKEKKEIKTSEIIKKTGFSRSYVNRFFKELEEDGKIILIGRSNNARYIKADKKSFENAKRSILKYHNVFANKDLSEGVVFDEINKTTGILMDLSKNIFEIVNYAFTEMLNNAIDHSKSKTIEVFMVRDDFSIRFSVFDNGIGIFNNIMKKKGLKNELEAIQELEKGKQTTDPKRHSGEGIFFTSKLADVFKILSSHKSLVFNNKVEDIFISDIKIRVDTKTSFTKVSFVIDLKSKKSLKKIFDLYTDGDFEFNKTAITVKLYKAGVSHISRSQAKRLLEGLDKFKIIILDFKDVDTVGQAFADEIFRVWQSNHKNIKILPQNTNENVMFMIKRAVK